MTEHSSSGQQDKDDPDELVGSREYGLLEGQPVFDLFAVIAFEEIIELDHPNLHKPDHSSELPVAQFGDPAVPLILAGRIDRLDCARPYIHSIHPPMLRKWARILSEMLQTAHFFIQGVQHDSPCSLQHLHSDCHAAFCRRQAAQYLQVVSAFHDITYRLLFDTFSRYDHH
jgi:hypothetical protein